jgi:hypothetical protein
MTLYPTPDSIYTNSLSSIWCVVCGDLGVIDVTLNCLLFLPLGLGLGLREVPRWRAICLIVGTTVTIEFLQLHWVTGRDASLSDVLTNTLGGISGYALASRWRHIIFPASRTSYRLAVGGALLWVAVQIITAFAMKIRLPESVYYGQWAPELAQFEQFTGGVTSVLLNRTPLPGWRLEQSSDIRRQLLHPESVLSVQAMTGKVTTGLAPIFSIYDENQREILLLGQKGHDLVFRIRTQSGPMRLRGPSVRLSGILPELPGLPLVVQVHIKSGHYDMTAEIGGKTYRREMSASASWGWSLLLPFDHSFGTEMPWLTMLWLGGLLLPIGYFASRSRRLSPARAMVVFPTLLITGLILVPLLGGLRPGAISEWVAAIAGSAVGWWLGSRSIETADTSTAPTGPTYAGTR